MRAEILIDVFIFEYLVIHNKKVCLCPFTINHFVDEWLAGYVGITQHLLNSVGVEVDCYFST
jgi:hypothetical protein